MPLLSIVMPSYNVDNLINETLDCIVGQTFDDWELFVVDDGSTDNTKSIVKIYEQKDNRIHLIERNRLPKGAQTCRNIGIENSSGKYIIVFDSDDLIAPFCFEQRVNFMEDNDKIDYATFRGQAFFLNEKGIKVFTHNWGTPTNKDILFKFLSADYPFGIWNNIYKTSVVKNVLFDEKIAIYQDFDFAVQTCIKGYIHRFATESKPDYFYRQGRAGAITSKFITDEKFISTKYLFSKTLEVIEKQKDREKYKKAFFRFFLLQYERVLVNGTDVQKSDFYMFIKENYQFSNSFRLNLLKNIGMKTNKKKLILVFGWILFEPFQIFVWLKNKLKTVFQQR